MFLLATRGMAIGWWVLALTLCTRMAMAWIIGIKYLKDPVARRLLWLVPVRDVMSFVFWICSFVGNTIEWRGRRFKLAEGGRLVAIEDLPARIENLAAPVSPRGRDLPQSK